MGQGLSREGEDEDSDLSHLSSIQLGGIGHEFNKLYVESSGKQGKLLDREAFAQHFKLHGILGDRLFEAFDTKKDGGVSFEEFGRGLAILLQGSVTDKCELLFRMFNLGGDEGVSRDELSLMVHATLQSAYTILRTCSPSSSAIMTGEGVFESVQRIVNEAFEKCDVSQTGKLSPQEFELWMRRNPALLDSITNWRSRHPAKRQGTANHPILKAVSPSPTADTPDTTSSVPEAASPDSPIPPTKVSHANTELDLDEVRLTPSSTPAMSRHETPAARDSPSVSRQSPLVLPSEPAVGVALEVQDMAEGQADNNEDLTRGERSASVRQEASLGDLTSPPNSPAAVDSTAEDDLDGERKRKRSSLPPAIFHSGEVHLVESPPRTQAPLAATPGSPLYENQPGSLMDPLPAGVVERQRTSWIASNQTKQLLATMATGSQLSRVDQAYLTKPGLVVDDCQIDPVRDLLNRFGLESEIRERHVLTVDSVTMDNMGLQKLLGSGCYRAALELTGRFLTAHGQGLGQRGQPALHTHKTLQMWLARIALLMKLHLFTAAQSELEAFGRMDSPDLYFDYYPDTYPGRTGCMVPFSLRILHAVLPQYTGHAMESMDRLEHLHNMVTKILFNLEQGVSEDGQRLELSDDDVKASKALWNRRLLDVDYSIANCCLTLKDYGLAVSVFQSITEREKNQSPALGCLIGRIYLQLGDLTSAREVFQHAEKQVAGNSEQQAVMHAMNEAFLFVATGSYAEAYRHFQIVFTHEPSNAVVVNNMAVCLLYMGQLGKAVQVLEELVWRDPPTHLQSGTICNLCTLYELQSSHATEKKLAILRLVSRHCGDGFLADCLKLST